MKLYRGLTQDVWETKLQDAGWPPDQAAAVAAFLVSNDAKPPTWESLVKPLLDEAMAAIAGQPYS